MLTSVLASANGLFGVLLNLLYPQDCLLCGIRINNLKVSPVCGDCIDKIRINPEASHIKGGAENFAFDRAFYATIYDETVKKCICLFKYEGKTQMARPLGNLLCDFALRNISAEEIDLIVPVPLHPVKLRERQFNQSELLASLLAGKMNISVARNKVKRIKYTAPQTELNRDQRLRNVRGAFRVRKNADFNEKAVLLVDDVLTTGATLHECAKALKGAGAKKVVALALARGN
jgi:competence protein ComFC